MERLFRTTLCAFWQQGVCQRGDACNFAHGEDRTISSTTMTRYHHAFSPSSFAARCITRRTSYATALAA